MNFRARLDELLDAETRDGRLAGASALVLHRGEEIYFGHSGYADLGDSQAGRPARPMERDTIIRLFSMTKPITAAAVMLLFERGMLDLNDPVAKYLPEFEKMKVLREDGSLEEVRWKPILLSHLLNMTSGIPYGENWEGCSAAGRRMMELTEPVIRRIDGGEHISTREMARVIASAPLAFEPGERWMYGYSADVLGAVVEEAAGMSFGEFLRKEIFAPLQMNDTGFRVPEEKKGRFAAAYHNWNEEKKLIPLEESHLGERYTAEDHADSNGSNSGASGTRPGEAGAAGTADLAPVFESGGAGLVSTLDDYARFAQMLVGGGSLDGVRILGERTVKFMAQNRLAPEQMGELDWDSNRGYGYGNLCRVLVDQGKAGTQAGLGEFGWDGWTGNYVSMDPENELVFLFFTQLCGGGTLPVTRKMRAVVYGAL